MTIRAARREPDGLHDLIIKKLTTDVFDKTDRELKKNRTSQKWMKEFLKGKMKSEMKEILKDLVSQYLSGLSQQALPDEHCEKCKVVKELINESA